MNEEIQRKEREVLDKRQQAEWHRNAGYQGEHSDAKAFELDQQANELANQVVQDRINADFEARKRFDSEMQALANAERAAKAAKAAEHQAWLDKTSSGIRALMRRDREEVLCLYRKADAAPDAELGVLLAAAQADLAKAAPNIVRNSLVIDALRAQILLYLDQIDRVEVRLAEPGGALISNELLRPRRCPLLTRAI